MVKESQKHYSMKELHDIRVFARKLIIFTFAGILLAITSAVIHYVNTQDIITDLESENEKD